MAKIIIIDDELEILNLVSRICEDLGHEAQAFQKGSEVVPKLSLMQPQLIIVDLRMGDMSGLEVLDAARQFCPRAAVVLMTGHASVDTAIEAMRRGAFDYLTKPFEPEDLRRIIASAIAGPVSAHSSSGGTCSWAELLEIKTRSDFISGSNHKMREIMKWVERVAKIDAPLLIEGEKGTGKNALAREIHLRSHRRQAPLKVLTATALTAEALMQEMSAVDDKPSLFERANGGTVVIEEVGSLPLRVQQRLENWINWQQASRLSGEFMPDFRLICTSSEPLEEMVKSGRFREELYYRLSVSTVALPPLRMRREDIDSIAEHVLSRVIKIYQLKVKSIENAAMVLLRNFSWPGNVAELENAIERAALASTDETVRVADLPPKLFQRVAPEPKPDTIHESLPIGSTLDEYSRRVERHFILETLKFNEGSREKTAAMLGISVATLYRKMGYKEDEA